MLLYPACWKLNICGALHHVSARGERPVVCGVRGYHVQLSHSCKYVPQNKGFY